MDHCDILVVDLFIYQSFQSSFIQIVISFQYDKYLSWCHNIEFISNRAPSYFRFKSPRVPRNDS